MNSQGVPEIGSETCRQKALLRDAPCDRTDGTATLSARGSCNAGELTEQLTSVFPAGIDQESLSSTTAALTFVPGLVGQYLAQPGLPRKQELSVLFVDIADSTSTILRQPPEAALAVVQRFMRLVTDIALAYCGDVKDYEGDGALLYFGSLVDATRAALTIRSALDAERSRGTLPLQARLSLNVGEVVIGEIGSPLRRSVALIGPAVSMASRLLKYISPGGIIAPREAVVQLRRDTPELADRFEGWGDCLILKGFEEECVTAYHIPEEELHHEERRALVS